jgi:hypothetical protein
MAFKQFLDLRPLYTEVSTYFWALILDAAYERFDKEQLDSGWVTPSTVPPRSYNSIERWLFIWQAICMGQKSCAVDLIRWHESVGPCMMLSDWAKWVGFITTPSECKQLGYNGYDAYYIPFSDPGICFVAAHEVEEWEIIRFKDADITEAKAFLESRKVYIGIDF